MHIPPVVILAGGLGTRLGVLGAEKPKALVDVAGTPFLKWKVDDLISQGAAQIYLLVGHKGGQIFEFVANTKFDASVSLISDGPTPLGTAEALAKALPLLSADSFILTYGDNLLPLRIEEFLKPRRELEKSLMVVTTFSGSNDACNARVEDGYVVEYHKRGSTNFDKVDYGYALLNKEDFTRVKKKSDSDLAQVFEELSITGKLLAFETDLPYFEIGTPESLQTTENWLRNTQL